MPPPSRGKPADAGAARARPAPTPQGRRPGEVRAHLLTVLAPVVERAGYDLEDVSVSAAGRRSLVRVTVDSDHGVDLDAVAEVSRAVSDALDDDTPGGAAFGGPFVLEVSSPGVDRPLTEPRHWRRAAGRLVTVPVDGAPVTGRVTDTGDTGVHLETDGAVRHVPWAELGTGRVQVEFSRPAAGTDDDSFGDDGDRVDEAEAEED